MTDPHGFLRTPRRPVPARPAEERLSDWNEIYAGQSLLPLVSEQAGRCMDCGIPFCHSGCPLGNLIPEWNAYAARGDWWAAAERLHATNNFPEFTGRLCPAPCEEACVLTINADPVTIKNVEQAIADQIWERGYAAPQPPQRLSGMTVAVIGSGPAGLAAAQQLTRIGHTVAVYERADRIGGLLRYGIPAFKMEKRHLDRRIEQMRAEGTRFRTGVDVGGDLDATELTRRHDAVVVAVGAMEQRELPVPGRELFGIHQAVDYLTLANRVSQGDHPSHPVTAAGKHVVIVGGGDTGSDCLGTALRQGAASVVQLDINPEPGDARTDTEPWPTYPKVYRISHAHEEARGREGTDPRVFSSATLHFEGGPAGQVRALRLTEVEPEARRPRPDTERVIPAELVLLALGFSGPERGTGLMRQLGLTLDDRGNFARNAAFAAETAPQDERTGRTRTDGVFVAGDAGRGQSLVVWAIAEGRSAAAATDRYLTGSTVLPAPVAPTDRPLAA
ncbi:glutamate synthase [Streptomyces lunaelactis]|uniref:Glutamate synthase n=1 Tax=Streptomyces lunaelactis TaxID=1535768 RepID=A0A2R4TCP4_9ACTN|nr:glutamate synthase subunit beta [Streptomyces lunaelactis]AVZ76898.1 glutamate synthase [Streptomyces lunaelactis]NUK86310.1 glutamate synthase subunit beta [Streptomyces lunaelactis]